MPAKQRSDTGDADIFYTVDDETYGELLELAGEPVAAITIWEDSIADALSEGELAGSAVDIDLYLEGGVYFELYGVLCYPDVESQPLTGVTLIDQRIVQLLKSGLDLEDVAVDDEDSLVLVLGSNGQALLFLNAGAWALGEWEELPEHAHVPPAPYEN